MQEKTIGMIAGSGGIDQGENARRMEAAITLQAFKEMLAADDQAIIFTDDEGNEFTAQDEVASMLAARINETPFYQEQFNIGGNTGRKVIGFSPLVHEKNRESIPPDQLAQLPQDAYVPIIENSKTNTIGPMTEGASTDTSDSVQYITLSNLEAIANGEENPSQDIPPAMSPQPSQQTPQIRQIQASIGRG